MHRFLHIAQDNFYRNLTSEEQANIGGFNFDHPAVSSSSESTRSCRAQPHPRSGYPSMGNACSTFARHRAAL